MIYSIYVLKSSKDNKLYTGYTSNIERRLKEHSQGIVKSTHNRRPLKLIYTETFSTSKEARSREKFLKSGQGREEFKKILSNY